MALSAVRARLGQAIIDIGLAQRASESGNAQTAERIDQIGARSSVQAGIIRLAVVNVRLAQGSGKTGWADTFKTVDLVDTRTAILAAIDSAVVNLNKSKKKADV